MTRQPLIQMYRRSLEALRAGLESKSRYVDVTVLEGIESELAEIHAHVPRADWPPFDKQALFGHQNEWGRWYKLEPLRGLLDRTIARLESEEAVAEPQISTLPNLNFSFLGDAAIRDVLVRDFRELQLVHAAGCWKAALVLAGSCIEGILYDVAVREWSQVKLTTTAKGSPDASRWTLGQLVSACREAKLLDPGVEKLSPALKDYRNLVHPAVEVREGLRAEEHEADIAVSLLQMVHRAFAPRTP